MARWPAVTFPQPAEQDEAGVTLALVDDFTPTAVDSHDDTIRIFFATEAARDSARAALRAAGYGAESIDVDDEDWARRSQEDLKPVTVGRLTIAPPTPNLQPPTSNLQPLTVIIQPSMGFGTGHHATTRLCLRALQAIDLSNRLVLDVGTGSGVLAIAAIRLGAASALGIDYDADAVQAANDNLPLNPGVAHAEFRVADLAAATLPPADVVTANLTGALLIRSAAQLLNLLRPGGALIVSGFVVEERDDVARGLGVAGDGLSDPKVVWEQHEDGWVGLTVKRS